MLHKISKHRINYKKDRTVFKGCYNKKKRKNNLIANEITTSHQQPKIENGNNSNRTLLVGPSFLGKISLMLKILSRIPNRDFYIITKSPPGQYSIS